MQNGKKQLKNISKQKLVAIVGPTASGKTDLALKLAKKFKGYIISADSRQIYQEMDIGTAKPVETQNSCFANSRTKFLLRKSKNKIKNGSNPTIINNIPYYLINLVRPDQEFTVFDYQKEVFRILKLFCHQFSLPFLVGGTGFYVSAIIDNLKFPQIPPNKDLRRKLETELKEKGIDFLYQKLIKLDSRAKYLVEPKNPRRIIRALEICLLSKKPLLGQKRKDKPIFDVLQIGLEIPKEKLKKRIDQRVEKMIKQGLIEETERLLKKGYSLDLPSMSGIGYREIAQWFIQGKKGSLDRVIEEIKLRTRQYAKRQLTWFKKDKRIYWIKEKREAEKLIQAFTFSKK